MAKAKRTARLTVCLTVAEEGAWEAAAGRERLDLSAFVRRAVWAAVDAQQPKAQPAWDSAVKRT